MLPAPPAGVALMALIPCPACQHQVSTEAVSCPQCGHPLKRGKGAIDGSTIGKVATVAGAAYAAPWLARIVAVVVFGIIAIVAVWLRN